MPRFGRRLALALLVSGLLLLVHGCSVSYSFCRGYTFDRSGVEQQRSTHGDIGLQVQHIVIDNCHGEVTIEAVAGPGDWHWDLTVWGTTASDATGYLESVDLQVSSTEGGQAWKLVLPQPPVRTLRGVQSDLRLRVPAGVVVRVDNAFGDTSVTGVHGRTEVYSSHGGVELASIGGPVLVRTSFDAIRVTRVGPAELHNEHGRITVHTVTGDLTAETCFGPVEIQQVRGKLHVLNEHGDVTVRDVHGVSAIRTSFGDLHLTDLRGAAVLRNQHGDITARELHSSVNARSSFGDIRLECAGPEIACQNQFGSTDLVVTRGSLRRVVAVNSYGDLSLAIPSVPRPRIDARTTFGEVHSDLPVVTGADAASHGDGNLPRISLRNQHGDIRVTRK